MQVISTARTTKYILALTSVLGRNPQSVIAHIRALPPETKSEDEVVCKTLGQIALGEKKEDDKVRFDIGKFILGLLKLKEQPDESAWQQIQKLIKDQFAKWVDNVDALKDLSIMMFLPVVTFQEHEETINAMDKMCKIEHNPESQIITKEFRCMLVDPPEKRIPKDLKSYVDMAFTRGINFKVTSYAVKHPHDIVLPAVPSETTNYNIAVARNEHGMWMTARFVFATQDRNTVRKIHEELIEKVQNKNLRIISYWLYSGEYGHLLIQSP